MACPSRPGARGSSRSRLAVTQTLPWKSTVLGWPVRRRVGWWGRPRGTTRWNRRALWTLESRRGILMATLARWRRGARLRGGLCCAFGRSPAVGRADADHILVQPESDVMEAEPFRFGAHIPHTGCICQGCFANVVFDDTHIPDDDHWMTYFQDDAQFKIYRCDSCYPLNVTRLAAQRRRAATRTDCICQGCSALNLQMIHFFPPKMHFFYHNRFSTHFSQ